MVSEPSPSPPSPSPSPLPSPSSFAEARDALSSSLVNLSHRLEVFQVDLAKMFQAIDAHLQQFEVPIPSDSSADHLLGSSNVLGATVETSCLMLPMPLDTASSESCFTIDDEMESESAVDSVLQQSTVDILPSDAPFLGLASTVGLAIHTQHKFSDGHHFKEKRCVEHTPPIVVRKIPFPDYTILGSGATESYYELPSTSVNVGRVALLNSHQCSPLVPINVGFTTFPDHIANSSPPACEKFLPHGNCLIQCPATSFVTISSEDVQFSKIVDYVLTTDGEDYQMSLSNPGSLDMRCGSKVQIGLEVETLVLHPPMNFSEHHVLYFPADTSSTALSLLMGSIPMGLTQSYFQGNLSSGAYAYRPPPKPPPFTQGQSLQSIAWAKCLRKCQVYYVAGIFTCSPPPKPSPLYRAHWAISICSVENLMFATLPHTILFDDVITKVTFR